MVWKPVLYWDMKDVLKTYFTKDFKYKAKNPSQIQERSKLLYFHFSILVIFPLFFEKKLMLFLYRSSLPFIFWYKICGRKNS